MNAYVKTVSVRVLAIGATLMLLGCATTQPVTPIPVASQPAPQVLQPGDVVRISYPGAPNLETTQQIRRDGYLNLAMIGEIKAEGKSAAALESELATAYASQLVSKEVKVTIISSSFAVFVTGAVVRPGKIQPDHTLTAFEAIMEAGGFDYSRANAKAVRVIRTHGSETQSYTLDLSPVLDGKSCAPFYLQSNDAVYVPEKFQWF